jgi:hypothetical protein
VKLNVKFRLEQEKSGEKFFVLSKSSRVEKTRETRSKMYLNSSNGKFCGFGRGEARTTIE